MERLLYDSADSLEYGLYITLSTKKRDQIIWQYNFMSLLTERATVITFSRILYN